MKHLLLACAFFFFGITTTQAQDYLQMIDEGTHQVSEVIAAAEAYFEDKDKGRGSGYKQFKRWEYMALRLQNADGYLRTIEQNLNELEEYNSFLNETADTRESLNSDWEELGPTSWNATTSWNPGVGRITGIAVDPTNTDHIIASANTGGIWRTTNGGDDWTPLNDNFSNLYSYAVAIDPSNSDTYYFGSSSGIIFKSTDAGATWNMIADVSSSLINKILVHPTNSDIIFASSQNAGIYKTFDGGATWASAVADSRGYDIEFKPGDPMIVYATGNAFHKSTDGGATFTSVSVGGGGPKMMGVSPDDASRLYVIEANSGSFGGLYSSTNEGDTFTTLNHTGRNYFGYDTAGFDPGGQAPRDMDIAVNPTNADEVHIAGILTWRSMNAGADFTITADWIPGNAANAGIGYCHADVDFLAFEGTTLYAGTDGGIFKAEDTGNITANYYEDITEGMGIRQWYKIGASKSANLVVTGGSQDNGSSFYTVADGWRDWIGADGMEGFVDKDNPNTMYGMIQNGRMYRTTNGGQTISNLNEPGNGSGNWVTPFEQDPLITNTIYLGYNRVYKSANSGGSWTAISQNFGNNLDNLKIAPSDSNIMYASEGGALYRTTDGGATNWTQTANPGGAINSIAIHPTNPNKIAVATTSAAKVRVSEDGGQTWINLFAGLPNFSALAVLWHDNGEDALYLGMDYGIYYIDNTFAEWQPYSNSLPNVIINELDIHEPTNTLLAASYGRGLWASPLGQPSLSVRDVLVADRVALSPNPGTDIVNIQFQQAVETSIKVFDTQGKLVIYEPENDTRRNHSVEISGLNTGMYFVRLETNLGTITKKLIKK